MPKPNRITEVLLGKLRTEEHFLRMPYYTWWFEYGRLEMMTPLTESFPTSRWGDWATLVDQLPAEALELIEQHDAEVEELRKACAELQESLESRSELQLLYRKVMTPELLTELQTTEATLFGARWPDTCFSYLAQLIVNKTPTDCSPLYTIRPFWLRFGDEFLALREISPYHELVVRSDEIVERLLKTIRRLDTAFTQSLMRSIPV